MHRIAGGLIAAGVVVALAGCADAGTPSSDPTPNATRTSTPTPTGAPAPVPLVFTVPDDCESALPESRLAEFATSGLTLLGGPGGKYGEQYLADPTPEESIGGITCIWGDNATDASSITVSIAPLGTSRATVVQNLLDQGLNQAIEGDLTLYAVQGDEVRAPAILNVLRSDSWISVIQTVGGAAAFDEAITVSDEAALIAYAPG